ncbi:MAG TPA: tetratricopeptide repeat protein [Cytophagaceae bacterium]|nr:tetratricopeptide repeat protein [Cytophagaceae bacterium]
MYVDKVLSDETEKRIKTNFYTDSIILKAKIEAENGDIHSIGTIESEFYRQKYQNINNKLSYILILMAEICGKFHKRGILKGVQRVLNNANDFTTYNEYKDLIGNINLNLHFSTDLKTKLMKCKDDYISLNKEPSEQIKAIIDSVSIKERKIKLLANTKIIMLSNKAIKRFGETKELLSILVIAKDEIAKDRGQFNSCIRLYLKLISMDPRNGVYYNNLSVMYNKTGNTKKAIKYIKLCIKLNFFSIESPLIFNNFLDFNDKKIAKSKRYGEARNLKDESIRALEDLTKNYIKNLATGVIHTSRNFIKLTQRITYKYRPFNVYTIESIINGYLYFSTLKDLNDPLDLPIFQMQKNVLLRHALYDNKDFKIFCSSLNGNNSLMWSHYAESHKGICIGYKISSLPLDIGWNIIDYKQPSVRSNEVVQEEGILNPGLFSKLHDWSYEEELRLIRFKKDGDKLFYSSRIKSFEKSQKMECIISEILLGYNFDKSNITLIKNIVTPINGQYKMLGLPSIKVYKMEQNENRPFSLMRKEIILGNK